MDIKLNKDLLSIVKGKRVVIVGPSPYLVGTSSGKDINSYDVVCRVNDIVPPLKLRDDYGDRTDIIFHNCGTRWMDGFRKKIAKYSEEFKKIKMGSCLAIKSEGNQNNYLDWPNDYVSDVVKNFEFINMHKIPFYWVGVEDYKKLHQAISVEPSQGVLAIAVLAQYPLKELAIKGFTFYLEGQNYDQAYFPEYREDYSGSIGHNMHPQLSFFKNLLKKHSHITLDPYFKNLL